jgi:hypothetical protein
MIRTLGLERSLSLLQVVLKHSSVSPLDVVDEAKGGVEAGLLAQKQAILSGSG